MKKFFKNKMGIMFIYIFILLHDYGIIKVKGNHGFWSALERHLVDFNGIPITTDLAWLARKISADPDAFRSCGKRVLDLVRATNERLVINQYDVIKPRPVLPLPLYKGFDPSAF
jgi:hypothetical protein